MITALEAVLRKPGRFVVKQYAASYETLLLLVHILRGMRGMLGTANRKVFVRQFYFTAVEPIPLVIAGAFLSGAVIVAFVFASLSSFGLSQRVGEAVMIILVNEIAALFVAVVVMIRSGSAIIAELALMRLNRELETLNALGIDLHEYLTAPRCAALVLSTVLLSVLFCFVSILGGFLAYGYLHNIAFYDYLEIMAEAAGFADFVTVYVKALMFGLIIALFSIRNGLDVTESITEVPVRLIAGLTRQTILIFFFVIFYDILRYGTVL